MRVSPARNPCVDSSILSLPIFFSQCNCSVRRTGVSEVLTQGRLGHGLAWRLEVQAGLARRVKTERHAMSFRLPVASEALADVCRRHNIRKLSLFGSALAGAERPESDVDLLVEFESEATPSLLDMATIEAELSLLLGKQVDLRTAEDLSRYFRDDVVRTAEVQYVSR